MADRYQPLEVERRWQEEWERSGLYRVDDRAVILQGDLRDSHGLQTCRHFDQHATHRKVADDDLLDSIKRRPELAGAVESNVRPTVA